MYAPALAPQRNEDELRNPVLFLFLCFLWFVGLFSPDSTIAFWSRLSLVVGFCVAFLKIYRAPIKNKKTTRVRELAFILKDPVAIFLDILIWPVSFLILVIDVPHSTYSEGYLWDFWHNKRRKCYGIHIETLRDWTEREEERVDIDAAKLQERVGRAGDVIQENAAPACRLAITTALIASTSRVVNAQTVTPKPDQKTTPRPTLQVDIRSSHFSDDKLPNPNLFNRVSLYERRWMLESITTASPNTPPSPTSPKNGRWYNEVGGGVFLTKTSSTWFSLVGYASQDQMNFRQVIVGGQFFYYSPSKLVIIGVPVMRYEQGLGDFSRRSFAVAANPIFKLGRKSIRNRLALSPDITVRKPLGKPLSWNAGLGFDVMVNKKNINRAEIAVLRNSLGQSQVRTRVVFNIPFN